ncbi:MAG: hypothetical protein ACM33B_13440 [Pseudomonadota bacterium]
MLPTGVAQVPLSRDDALRRDLGRANAELMRTRRQSERSSRVYADMLAARLTPRRTVT